MNRKRFIGAIAFAGFGLSLIAHGLAFFGIDPTQFFPIENGIYTLQSHGTVLKVISEQESQQHQAYVIRGFSGHWMIFYLLPALYFWSSGKPSKPTA